MSQVDFLSNENRTKPNIFLKCRGCLRDEQNMNSLFIKFLKEKTLAKIIEDSTGYVITSTEKERFSQHLCKECTRILLDFVRFKTTFQEATKYFQNFHITPNIDQNTKDFYCKKFDNNCKEDLTVSESHIERENEIKNENSEDSDNFAEILHDETTQSYQKSKKIKCDMCDERFKFKIQLQRHKRVDHRKIRGCRKQPKKCNLNFKNHYEKSDVIVLKANTRLKDVSSNSKKPCKICKEEFPTEEFDYHFETHKIHACNICGHKFIRKTDLSDHQETHLDVCKYVCQHCGKAFKVRTSLNKHKRIHTNPREEICDVCGQRFNTRDTLKTHYKLKHIKLKDFQCNLCGLAFTLKSTLEKHIERHTPNRQRIYTCNLCNVSYINKYNLSRHHIIKHTAFKSRPTCEFCGKGYVKKIDLEKHVKKHHCQNAKQEKNTMEL